LNHYLMANDSGNIPQADTILSQQEVVLLKRRIFAMKRDNLPPVVTHNMEDDANDPILCHFRRVGMYNHPSDKVIICGWFFCV